MQGDVSNDKLYSDTWARRPLWQDGLDYRYGAVWVSRKFILMEMVGTERGMVLDIF